MNTAGRSAPPGGDVTSSAAPLRLNPTDGKGIAYAGAGLRVLVAPGIAVPSFRLLLAGAIAMSRSVGAPLPG